MGLVGFVCGHGWQGYFKADGDQSREERQEVTKYGTWQRLLETRGA